ncbi:hypothetical protein AAIG11_14675 [Anoxynatronum sibiricum]|uniref:DNA polymerase Y-family little finger domain-containing protein n=1 Tax=Anoxynatronum sibiricum TaxID=210623 RepID=A0ABU9VX38_9CLOT
MTNRNQELLSYRRQRALDTPTDITTHLWQHACRLFDEVWKGDPIRHLGVHVSELCSNDFCQLTIFDRDVDRLCRIDRTIDHLRDRFGTDAVFRGCFAHSPIRPMMGGVLQDQEEAYPMMSSYL